MPDYAPIGEVPRRVTTDADIEAFVRRSIQEGADPRDFDVPGIVDEIISLYGLVSPETIDYAPYWAIVARHDVTQM